MGTGQQFLPKTQQGPRVQPISRANNAEIGESNQHLQAGLQEAPALEAAHLPAPIPAVGELSYYADRHADFVSRYQDVPGLQPPDYYLDYGNKYVSRFTHETYTRLTPEGQAWLVRVRQGLQVAIESQRAADPAAFDQLEKDNAAFRAFAYGTHPDAYWNTGLGELSVFDLLNIGLTPDVEDLLSKDGIIQVSDIAGRLLGAWGTDALDHVAGDGTTEALVETAYTGLVVVGDGIDTVFGEGTAQGLLDVASALGVAAEELAEDAYDVAAGAAGLAAGGLDTVFGEGATSWAANGARELGQDAVDTVEDGVNITTSWISDRWDALF